MTINVLEEDVDIVQLAHAEYEVLDDTLKMFFGVHEKDLQPIIEHTSIDTLTKRVAQKKLAFEKAKAELIKKYLPDYTGDWKLDYSTCVITYGEG